MSDPDDLEARVRAILSRLGDLREVHMFGELGFLLNGYFVVSVSSQGLLAWVGREPEREAEALTRRGAMSVVMRGRPMRGYVRVAPKALDTHALKAWVRLALQSIGSPSAKRAGTPPRGAKARKRA